ncbi:hypothetical protein LTR12_008204 [Friedmanniomyces endolithicus]|nr:hypothetical protein LTR12_008204 [Friedmanniomyces endolithicus]
MRHPDGFSVRLGHGDLYYDEDPKFTRSDGRLNSSDSAVAIARTLGVDEAEPFTFEMTLNKGFQWYAASAVCAVVRIGIHGQENIVRTFVTPEHETSVRYRVLKFDTTMANPCGLLPAPQEDDPQSIRVRGRSQVADPGTVLVFVARGHEAETAVRSSHGWYSPTDRYTRVSNGVTISRVFQPLNSINGVWARFEFQIRSKGHSSTGVHAGATVETAGGHHLSMGRRARSEDQVDTTQQQEQAMELGRLAKAGVARALAYASLRESEFWAGNAPVCPLMSKTGGHAANDPTPNVGPADYSHASIGAGHVQHTSTAAQSLETNEVRHAAIPAVDPTSLPACASIEWRQQIQQVPSPAPTVHERRVKSESFAPLHSEPRPPTQPSRTLIDLTSDNEEPVAVKKEPKEKARTHPVPPVEDDGDEVAELKHQLAALEYERRKTRLEAEKQQQELELKHKSEESELKHTWEEAELNRRLVKAVEREKKKQRVAAAQEG